MLLCTVKPAELVAVTFPDAKPSFGPENFLPAGTLGGVVPDDPDREPGRKPPGNPRLATAQEPAVAGRIETVRADTGPVEDDVPVTVTHEPTRTDDAGTVTVRLMTVEAVTSTDT
jgi:hypothetical protein